MKESPDKDIPQKTVNNKEATKTTLSYKSIFREKILWLFFLAKVGYFLAFNAINTWAPAYLFETFGFSLVDASLVLSVFLGLGIVGAPLGGIVAGKVIERKALVILIGFMSMSLGCLVIAFFSFSVVWQAIGLLILIGILGSLAGGLGIAILVEWFPLEIIGTISGFMNLSTLGGAVSPYIFGAVLDITGSFIMGWVVSGGISIVLVMLMIPIITARAGNPHIRRNIKV